MSGKTLEHAVLTAFPWLIVGLTIAPPLLLFPGSSDRRWDVIVHLTLLVGFSLALTWRLAEYHSQSWFTDHAWSAPRTYFAITTALVVIVTGVTALVTIASAAALRFDPSLQFLQLLSALDIAWVVAGTTLAVRSLWGPTRAAVAGVMMSVVCIISIALYLAKVGLAPSGGWVVDGGEMLRLVLPFDVVAALLTVTLVSVGARRSAD